MFGLPQRIVELLLAIHKQNTETHRLIGQVMTDAATAKADLDEATAEILTAVTDASNAIRDLANKLSGASSVNPGDVESTAMQLKSIAAGLEAVVAAANEPVTAPEPTPAPVPEPTPVPVVPATPVPETPPAA